MRILHLIPSFGSGGAERQLVAISAGLADKGYDIHIGYCSDGPNLEYLRSGKVKLHKLSSVNSHDPRLLWNVAALIRSVKPDFVQTWLLQMDVLGGIASRMCGVPYIVSERSSALAYVKNWKNRLRVKVAKHALCVLANSNGGLDYWKKVLPELPQHMIGNCIVPPCVKGDGIEAQQGNSFSGPIVLFAGRLSYEKNIPVLMDTLVSVVKAHPSAEAVIIGDGPLRHFMEQRINSENLTTRIHVLGYSAQLPTWMKKASICVSLSSFEGTPNVVLEAAEYGCPLVLSDIQAHRELFDDSSAWMVDTQSSESASAVVLHVLSNRHEALNRAQMAKRVVSKYSVEEILGQYHGFYTSIHRGLVCG